MSVLDALWHLLNFFAPALGVGLLAAAITKGLWWGDLRSVSWLRLAGWAVLCAAAALLAGLVLTGRDGKMLTYTAMVAASAAGLWWAAFGPTRR
ncbi:MAG: hypothetical protein RLZZ618_3230 [Pseudomonadota bacterium]|jgi:hypothetical protein